MVKLSNRDTIRDLYDNSADFYARMMDVGTGFSPRSSTLERLRDRIADTPGLLVDTACGSGHMLFLYRKTCDEQRLLLGVDLSPRAVALAAKRLGMHARVVVGDMCELSMIKAESAAAVINVFALHHLDPKDVLRALKDWFRVLSPKGQLLIAAWEGCGHIAFGEDTSIVAQKHSRDTLVSLVQSAGFSINSCLVEPVMGTPMNAVFLEGSKK